MNDKLHEFMKAKAHCYHTITRYFMRYVRAENAMEFIALISAIEKYNEISEELVEMDKDEILSHYEGSNDINYDFAKHYGETKE